MYMGGNVGYYSGQRDHTGIPSTHRNLRDGSFIIAFSCVVCAIVSCSLITLIHTRVMFSSSFTFCTITSKETTMTTVSMSFPKKIISIFINLFEVKKISSYSCKCRKNFQIRLFCTHLQNSPFQRGIFSHAYSYVTSFLGRCFL